MRSYVVLFAVIVASACLLFFSVDSPPEVDPQASFPSVGSTEPAREPPPTTPDAATPSALDRAMQTEPASSDSTISSTPDSLEGGIETTGTAKAEEDEPTASSTTLSQAPASDDSDPNRAFDGDFAKQKALYEAKLAKAMEDLRRSVTEGTDPLAERPNRPQGGDQGERGVADDEPQTEIPSNDDKHERMEQVPPNEQDEVRGGMTQEQVDEPAVEPAVEPTVEPAVEPAVEPVQTQTETEKEVQVQSECEAETEKEVQVQSQQEAGEERTQGKKVQTDRPAHPPAAIRATVSVLSESDNTTREASLDETPASNTADEKSLEKNVEASVFPANILSSLGVSKQLVSEVQLYYEKQGGRQLLSSLALVCVLMLAYLLRPRNSIEEVSPGSQSKSPSTLQASELTEEPAVAAAAGAAPGEGSAELSPSPAVFREEPSLQGSSALLNGMAGQPSAMENSAGVALAGTSSRQDSPAHRAFCDQCGEGVTLDTQALQGKMTLRESLDRHLPDHENLPKHMPDLGAGWLDETLGHLQYLADSNWDPESFAELFEAVVIYESARDGGTYDPTQPTVTRKQLKHFARSHQGQLRKLVGESYQYRLASLEATDDPVTFEQFLSAYKLQSTTLPRSHIREMKAKLGDIKIGA